MKIVNYFLLSVFTPGLASAWEPTCTGSMKESGMSSLQIYLQCYPKTVMGSVLLVGVGLFIAMYLKRKK
jgi:hypothetical protein